MLGFPNAKINLGLHITRKRDDGFHDIETIFYPVMNLRDVLEIVPATSTAARSDEGYAFFPSGLPIGGDASQNLVCRAYELLKTHCPGKIPALDIYLHKAIPMGAGLGGGSADAAFVLQMINECCSLEIQGVELERLALQLGSDCPFFIRNTPQFASGRGEKMEPVEIDLSPYRIEVAYPDVHVSTRAAFSRIIPKTPLLDLRTLPQIAISEWRSVLHNDFEESVFILHPEIAATKEKLYADGAIYASMSGSGSAVYGVFEK